MISNEKFELAIKKMREHYMIAIEALTEKQFVDALRQMIQSGDFKRFVTTDSSQQVVYIPYAREQELENEIKRLKEILAENDINPEDYQ